MTNNNLEWLLDKDWEPTSVTIYSNRGNEYDEQEAKRMGYKDVSHMNAYNYNKDMLCKINHGVNCKRNT